MVLAGIAALLALLLQLLSASGAPAETGSLCYNFTVRIQSPRGRRWGEVQGRVDDQPFLHYDFDNVVPLGPLGEKVSGIKEWDEQTQTLADIGAELRQRVLDIKLENHTPRAPVALQAQLCCQLGADGSPRASWEFGSDGQTLLHFDPETMNWKQVHSGARLMKGWEQDRAVATWLKRTSEGDCSSWLRAFWPHWEEALRPPGT
ncbi:UL16-binding protein 6-like [Rhynchocyon petersi]